MKTLALVAVCAALCLSGCASAAPAASPSGAARPASPAHVSLLSPTAGETITGGTMHVSVSLTGASLTATTSTHISPTEGHLHLFVDSRLIYMNYSLTTDVQLPPGPHSVYVEFVAADHLPFNPRVVTPTIFVTVAG